MFKSKILLLAALICLAFSGTSCAQPSKIPEPVKKARKSFSFIKIKSVASPIKCSFLEKSMGESKIKECDIKSLSPLTLRSYGSGMVVKHVIDSTYVMTAAHVCWSPKNDTKTLGHKTITVKVDSMITVTDGHGKDYVAEIYAMDSKNDICILRAKGTFGFPVPIADKEPDLPERVYTYGAPLAIHHPGVILMFSGITAGRLNQGERTVNFYTLVARPGSSGSSILNNKGEIVGLIHTAITNLESVAIGSSLKPIQTIVNSIPEVFYERVD